MELTKEMLAGKDEVRIMNATMGGERMVEGSAHILKIHQGDVQGVDADVEFVEEPGQTYRRWVFSNDQS